MTPKDSIERAAKPPFYKNVVVRYPVNPLLPLGKNKVLTLRQMQPCVVMGRGHSGTRLVAWICHHLGIAMGADAEKTPSGDPVERSFKHHQRLVATHSLRQNSPDELRAVDLNRFQKAVYGYHQRLAVHSDRWGWKFPETYLIGPYVERTFPKARYIHLLRDGRDLAFKRHLTDVPTHRLARAILRRKGALGLAHHLQAAASWELQVELFEQFRERVSDTRILELRYEDLAVDPLSAAHRICAFLDLPMTSAAGDYASNSINADQISAFRTQDAMKLRQVEHQIGDTLRRLGYLPDAGSE